MKTKLLVTVLLAGSLALPAWAPGAAAQAYPVKPVRLIIPYAPGGSADFVGRIVAQKLGDALGQQILADNRAGANGNIGTELAAKANADGYTLLLASEIQFVINPAAFPSLRQDLLREFDPITLITVAYNLMVVNSELPVKNVNELVAYARANPGKINFGSPGTASPNHLSLELLALQTGTRMVHVPYKGAGQVLPDLMVGRIQLLMGSIPAVMPQLGTGRIRVLGMGGPQRVSSMPDVPTVAEQGFPWFESSVAWSLFTHAGAPRAVIERLHDEVVKLLGEPDVRARFDKAGLTPIGSTPAQLAARLKDDQNKWPKVIREAGIKVQQ
ncbi:MAG: tripartite tricarboxylate transporter substrate binding protein [Burkholderiales bacterium]|nr:tripartite tricarboxylate transporter substrate binding protein [Burkholderiales bacterium]